MLFRQIHTFTEFIHRLLANAKKTSLGSFQINYQQKCRCVCNNQERRWKNMTFASPAQPISGQYHDQDRQKRQRGKEHTRDACPKNDIASLLR